MPRAGCPLTPYQVRILGAVPPGGCRALEIANRSGLRCEVIYPALARLVGRGLLSKGGGSRLPTYAKTAKGERELAASRDYLQAVKAS